MTHPTKLASRRTETIMAWILFSALGVGMIAAAISVATNKSIPPANVTIALFAAWAVQLTSAPVFLKLQRRVIELECIIAENSPSNSDQLN